MKTPRDISGQELVKALKVFGYRFIRQNGSHITVTTMENGEHHIAIPNHNPIKIGTFNSIIALVAQHFRLTKNQVLDKLF